MRARRMTKGIGGALAGVILATVFLATTAGPATAAWDSYSWTNLLQPSAGTLTPAVCSDMTGGTYVAAVDDSSTYQLKIMVDRVDHVGTEVWGAGGIVLPYDLNSDDQQGPLAVAPDGNGGVFCAFRTVYGTQQILTVDHVLDSGVVDHATLVGDFVADNDWLGVVAVPAGAGACIVVWTQNNPSPNQELRVARVTDAGVIDWQAGTGLGFATTGFDPDVWGARSDGAGGVLVFANHVPPSDSSKHHYVQRISAAGVVLWGAGGVEAWNWSGYDIFDVVPDGSGGAYACGAGHWGDITAQHLDGTGVATWTAGGIAVQNLNTYPARSSPSVCADGAGGFVLAQGVEDIVVQRVDLQGNLLWGGSAGITLTTLDGNQENPDIAPDGFGGFVLAYEDHYFSDYDDSGNRALSAIRLDGFGNKIWQNDGFFWTLVAGQTGRQPVEPIVVPDGSGGVQVIWSQIYSSPLQNEIYGSGLGAGDGSCPAEPVLAVITPDAGAPGDQPAVDVQGDYLDTAFTYELRGATKTVAITGTSNPTFRELAGAVDLTGAPWGAYDLVCRFSSTVHATLANAFGVGEAPYCTGDVPVPVSSYVPLSSGRQRRAAVDGSGRAHYVWIEAADTGTFDIHHWYQTAPFGSNDDVVYSSLLPLTGLSMVLDANDDLHLVFIVHNGSQQLLTYFAGGAVQSQLLSPTDAANPVVAINAQGDEMVVFESMIGGSPWLFYSPVVGSNLNGWTDLVSGAGASEADLVGTQNGFALTFVRDFWFPGLREVCYQLYQAGSWSEPQGMYFGVNVWSPSVAWDGGQNLLFAFMLDNTGSDPLVHTMKMTGGTAGNVRWRLNDSPADHCAVGASSSDQFMLLTEEQVASQQTSLHLRYGDGDVFYPWREINSNPDVGLPALGYRLNVPAVLAVWEDGGNGLSPFSYYYCAQPTTGVVPAPSADMGLAAAPNPFNPRTTFSFALPADGPARLEVVDMRGRVVRTLRDGTLTAGRQQVVWDGRDDAGRRLASGVYFGRLSWAGGGEVTKVMMIK